MYENDQRTDASWTFGNDTILNNCDGYKSGKRSLVEQHELRANK